MMGFDFRSAVIAKMNPKVFMPSTRFMAILAHLLHAGAWTKPAIASMVCTTDGFILLQNDDDIGHNAFLGPRSELVRNILGAAEVAGLTPQERRYLLNQVPTPTGVATERTK